jgi:hypothetical protein
LVYNVCLLFCLHIKVEDSAYHVDATPNAKADNHALSILSLDSVNAGVYGSMRSAV